MMRVVCGIELPKEGNWKHNKKVYFMEITKEEEEELYSINISNKNFNKSNF